MTLGRIFPPKASLNDANSASNGTSGRPHPTASKRRLMQRNANRRLDRAAKPRGSTAQKKTQPIRLRLALLS